MQSMRGASIACALTMALVADAEASRGYLGIDVVVRPEGLMVWRVLPGPLDGTLLDCASVARGDLIVSIDGEAASIESWNAISARESGSKVRIGYRVGEPRGWRGEPNLAGEAREMSVTLDDESIWRGWCHSGELPPLRALELKADVDCAALVRALDSMGPAARARGEKLIASLDTIAPTHGDPATPPLLRAMMAEPAKSEALVRAAICDASDFRTTPWRGGAKLVLGLSGNSGAPLPEPHGAFKIERAEDGVNYLDFLLNGARALFEQSVARDPAPPSGLRSLVVERLDELLVRGPHSRESMIALQAIPLMNPAKAAAILAHFDVTDEFSPSLLSGEPSSVPDTIKTAVEGSILAAREIPQIGWVVVGAAGPNRYDLGRIAAVLDLGGDDTYAWKQAPGQHRLVIDLAGNDVHTGGEIGHGGSLGAISVIDDRAGNDRYEGGALTAGTALGVAAIVDRAGDDVYSAGPWSLGAAAGGAGIVIDLAGSDRIAAEGMSIGVGGPSAVGAFVDLAGDDLANMRASAWGSGSDSDLRRRAELAPTSTLKDATNASRASSAKGAATTSASGSPSTRRVTMSRLPTATGLVRRRINPQESLSISVETTSMSGAPPRILARPGTSRSATSSMRRATTATARTACPSARRRSRRSPSPSTAAAQISTAPPASPSARSRTTSTTSMPKDSDHSPSSSTSLVSISTRWDEPTRAASRVRKVREHD